MDLEIRPGPGAPSGLIIPAADLDEQFSRSSGPGGQSVNTTDSRVQLSLDLAATASLTETQRRRALSALQLTGTVLTVSASEHRSQHRNRVAARERLADIIRDAIVPPVPRRPTKPSRAARRRMRESKRRRSEIKQSRRRPDPRT